MATYHGAQAGIILKTNFATRNPVTIASDGIITGTAGKYGGDAVYGATSPWTITNYGAVSGAGTAGAGIYLKAGGSVTNGHSGSSGGAITGTARGVGIYLSGTASGTVTNFGAITATAGHVSSFGTFSQYVGAEGIYIGCGLGTRGTGAGVVINSGTITAAGSNADGVDIFGFTIAGATITNLGTILATGSNSTGALTFNENIAVITNGQNNSGSALISGGKYGVFADGFGHLITNFGTIRATQTDGIGVFLNTGGTITNAITGLITGSKTGIYVYPFDDTATITNFGTIFGGTGLYALRDTRAHPSLHIYSYPIADPTTLINAGAVIGTAGTAVSFGLGNDLLIVDPGAVFVGKVDGSAGENTIELAAGGVTGILRGFGTSFVNFGTITVNAGARWVLSGGNTIGAGGTLSNLGTLSDAGTLVDAGTVRGGGRLIVHSGGSEIVLSGGASSGTVLSGGSETISKGGTASGDTVASGGVERVYGRANWGSVASGGHQYVSSGGVASGVTVKHGGNQTVFLGGTTRGTVLSGGVEVVRGTASGSTVDSGGVETVYGKASGAVINGGVFEVASGGSAGGTVTFVSGGTLQLDVGASFTGAIKDFGKPDLLDRIDLRGIVFGSNATRGFTEEGSGTSGTLSVTDGTHTITLTLLGFYTTSNFTVSPDTHGGTLVTDPPVAGGASQTTFADIAPAGLHIGAAAPENPAIFLPGASAANAQSHAGETLLATGPPGGDHHPLLPVPR